MRDIETDLAYNHFRDEMSQTAEILEEFVDPAAERPVSLRDWIDAWMDEDESPHLQPSPMPAQTPHPDDSWDEPRY
jgi:hypothetical protein